MGKEYSANVFNELINNNDGLRTIVPNPESGQSRQGDTQQPKTGHEESHIQDSSLGSILSTIFPEPTFNTDDNTLPKRKKKKKRKYGRQV